MLVCVTELVGVFEVFVFCCIGLNVRLSDSAEYCQLSVSPESILLIWFFYKENKLTFLLKIKFFKNKSKFTIKLALLIALLLLLLLFKADWLEYRLE